MLCYAKELNKKLVSFREMRLGSVAGGFNQMTGGATFNAEQVSDATWQQQREELNVQYTLAVEVRPVPRSNLGYTLPRLPYLGVAFLHCSHVLSALLIRLLSRCRTSGLASCSSPAAPLASRLARNRACGHRLYGSRLAARRVARELMRNEPRCERARCATSPAFFAGGRHSGSAAYSYITPPPLQERVPIFEKLKSDMDIDDPLNQPWSDAQHPPAPLRLEQASHSIA